MDCFSGSVSLSMSIKEIGNYYHHLRLHKNVSYCCRTIVDRFDFYRPVHRTAVWCHHLRSVADPPGIGVLDYQTDCCNEWTSIAVS